MVISYVDEIKDRIKLSAIISKKVDLKRKNNQNLYGLCPFHNEKTPSFHVNDEKKFFHCFGCGASGDIFDFMQMSYGLDFNEALYDLANQAGININKVKVVDNKGVLYEIYEIVSKYYIDQLNNEDYVKCKQYLYNRGIDDEAISYFGLGFAPLKSGDLMNILQKKYAINDILRSGLFKKDEKHNIKSFFYNRIMFPIKDNRGRVIAFGGRIIDGKGPKYINSAESEIFFKSHNLYNMDKAAKAVRIDSSLRIVVVEGYMDVIAMHMAGIRHAVAPMGTAFNTDQLSVIWDCCDEPIILFDNDSAGKNAVSKLVYNVLPNICESKTLMIATIVGAKDPDEFIRKFSKEEIADVLKNSIHMSEYVYQQELDKVMNGRLSDASNAFSPEEMAKLEFALMFAAQSIVNKNVQKYYKRFFQDKLWKNYNKKVAKHDNKRNSIAHYIIDDAEKLLKMQRQLTTVIIMYPQLLLDNMIFEGYNDILFDESEMQILQQQVLSEFEKIRFIYDEKEKLAEFFVAMSKKFFTDNFLFRKNIIEVVDYQEAFLYAVRLINLLNLNKLRKEINDLSNQILSEGDQLEFQRFVYLCNEEEKLKLELGVI